MVYNKSSKDQVQSDVIRKVMSMLEGMHHLSDNTLVLNHVVLMLEDHDAKQAESEQLLCSLITLILNSFSIHIDQDSTLHTQIKLLQLRLMSPVTNTELVALQHYVESCADDITQLPDLKEKEITETLEPLLNSFGLDNNRPYFKLRQSIENKGIQETILESRKSTSEENSNDNVVSFDDSMKQLISSNYLSNSIAQSEKFGVLLEVELASLKSLEDDESFEEKKNAVLNKLENVLGSHQQLTQYFQEMTDFISGVQKDSVRLSEELDRVTMLSLTDELTGLPNRRAFIQQLNDEIARVKRYGNNLSLAVMDIDHFKPINDQYGHITGDRVLKKYTQDVLSMFRQHDMVARYGGEEFVVIFPGTDLQGALQALDHVRERAGQSFFKMNDENVQLPTFSAGLVSYQDDETPEQFIHRADQYLYKAKSSGRNCIECESATQNMEELSH